MANALASQSVCDEPNSDPSSQAHDVIETPPEKDAGWLCCGCVAVADWACHRR